MQESFVKEITARSPIDLLIKIYKAQKNSVLKILLKSGVFIEGSIIHISENDGIYKNVCFLMEDKSIGFFELAEVSLVSVKQPKQLIVELSDGTVSRPLNEDENLTLLKFNRWLLNQESMFDKPVKLIVAKDLSEVNQRLNVKDVIEALTVAVNQVCKDNLGKSAWAEIVSVEIVGSDEKIFLKKNDNKVEVYVNYNKALPSQLSEILEEKLLSIL